jgi:hypothetical protein
MAFKIWNIGKANEEIARLQALVDSKPVSSESEQLKEAVSSNDQLSAQLEKANGENEASKLTISTLTASLETAQNQVNAIGGQLKAACIALTLGVKEGASSAEMITALQTGVTSTLAKLQVDAAKVPAGKPANAAGESVKKKTLDDEIKERNAANPTK